MEQPRLNLYNIDMKYIRNLAKKDKNVMSVSPQIDKSLRPFVGILILINNRSYCIPLTSPKPKFENKKNSVDFIKILHPTEKNIYGAFKVIRALNLNNMIPVDISLLKQVDLKIKASDNSYTKSYKELMKNQLNWCQSNQEVILKKANQLYNLITNHADDNKSLARRCCNFKVLEQVLDNYIKNQSIKGQELSEQSQKRNSNPFGRKNIQKNADIIKKKPLNQKQSPSKHKGKDNPNL